MRSSVDVCVYCVSQRSRANEVAVVETNGKDQDHDHRADTSDVSQDEPSKSGAEQLCDLCHICCLQFSCMPLGLIMFLACFCSEVDSY